MNIRLFMPSTILLEQVRTVDKRRLGEWVGHLTDPQMQELDDRLKISLGLN
jgi:mRNA interferase MazF